MRNSKYKFLGALLAIVFVFTTQVYADIVNNQNATDLIGQYDDAEATIVNYTRSTLNNGAGSVNNLGLKEPVGLLLDQTNHRLFVGDRGNHRVLVYNLNTNNDLIDRVPDYVLGQPDFTTNTAATTQAGMSAPNEFAYDSVNNYLFVAEGNNNRVTVYDVSTITNGENAIYVLGQPDFTTSTALTTQAGMSGAFGVAYDSDNQKLFVSQYGSRRVTVYDVSTITNGEDAIYVLGQPDFTTSTAATTQAGVGTVRGLGYDSNNDRLFLADTLYHRITVYDVSTITNGEDAVYVIGQPDFTTSTATYTQSGLNGTKAVAYDSVNNRLFAADSWSHRVTVYDVSTITNGEDAIYVLGQPDFTSHAGSTTQAGMRDPVGLAFNQTTQKLFVSNFNNNNVTIYDFGNPTITSASSSNILNTGSTITWTTNENSSSIVEYGLTSNYGSTTTEADTGEGTTFHTVNLSNLTECTIYHYRVKSNDPSANLGTSSDSTFTTPGCSAVSVVLLQQMSDAMRAQESTVVLPPPTTPTNTIVFCESGQLFNPNTGERCTSQTNTTSKFIFLKNLKYKDNNTDVKELQKFLNSNGFTISTTGPGSIGNETNYFGLGTRSALIKYQIANNIKPAVGYFGPLTRSKVNQ